MRTIEEIKKRALEERVPIMEDEGIGILTELIQREDITQILEIGSAVGYSAICMASIRPSLKITTIEKDPLRAMKARENIELSGYKEQIELVGMDALRYLPGQMYDLLVIDAAKGANQRFLDRFAPFVRKGGYIAADDVWFHGFVDDPSTIRTKHMRVMVDKIREFRDSFLANPEYESTYYKTGDGMIIARKK